MKKIIAVILLLLMLLPCAAVFGSLNEDFVSSDNNILVAYFSCTEKTEGVAKHISDIIGADIYKIKPVQPYTAEDLDYGNTSSRTSIEQNNPNARPDILEPITDINQYDIVFLGYPIWWGQTPKIISTFLESLDFSGKTIIPFCTSGSSGIGSSAENLHSLASGANWLDGMRFRGGANETEVKEWIDTLDLSAAEPEISVENEIVTVTKAPENSILLLIFYKEGILINVEAKRGIGTITENISDKSKNADLMKAFLWDVETIRPLCSGIEIGTEENKIMCIKAASDEYEVIYELNQSRAAKDLYAQLPLKLEIENYSTNEKIFYPPKQLDVSDAMPATGGSGTLAYFSPWADVVMFYDDFNEGSNLYELGKAVSGTENIEKLNGIITVAACD